MYHSIIPATPHSLRRRQYPVPAVPYRVVCQVLRASIGVRSMSSCRQLLEVQDHGEEEDTMAKRVRYYSTTVRRQVLHKGMQTGTTVP
jgi:hypothetical protein